MKMPTTFLMALAGLATGTLTGLTLALAILGYAVATPLLVCVIFAILTLIPASWSLGSAEKSPGSPGVHRHYWVEISRNVMPGTLSRPNWKIDGPVPSNAMTNVLYGVTVIEQQCQIVGCGKVRVLRFTGATEAPHD